VPAHTQGVEEADRLVHVMHLSEDDYLRSAEARGYNTDEDFVESIKGEGKPDQKYEESRYTAEGLSYSNLKDLIILWEVYLRQSDARSRFRPSVHSSRMNRPGAVSLPYQHKQILIVQFLRTDRS
jgi:hypothetical protein